MKKKNKGKAKDRIKNKNFKDLNISLLEEHHRNGKNLLSPLSRLPSPISKLSWYNDALNEILWIAILRGNLEQRKCLDLFRRVIVNARENIPECKDTFISHSALSALDDDLFDRFMKPILESEDAKKLLSGLLYFECLPDRKHWLRHLDSPTPKSHNQLVINGVASCFEHQSQEATDVRWFKVMHMAIVQERIHFPESMTEKCEELRLYPDYGDQRKVRPSIRALEMSLRTSHDSRGIPSEIPDTIRSKVPAPWSEKFWKECLEKTECITCDFKRPEPPKKSEYFEQIYDIYHQLSEHFITSAENTNLDARRDTCFGIVLYSLFLTFGLASSTVPLACRAEGRITLRTIVENFITLKYLEHKDDPVEWMKFRTYGTGKSKMAFLKNIQVEDVPNFINLQDLHTYSNEDMWQEFSDIGISTWTDKNLRKMAEDAGIKDFYDKYYDWSSGYVHGNWSAIRDTIFTICLNPLHRYHRIPFVPKFDMPSVLPDIAKITNMMLEIVNRFYPRFRPRIKHTEQPKAEKSSRDQ